MTADKPKVTAVIVTYQSRHAVGAALDALYKAHLAGLADAVVVDNASIDGTADFVAEHYPWAAIIRSNENLGYGCGCNLGFQHVASPYVLILNPDAVLDEHALRVLVAFMDSRPQAGIAAPAILEGDGHALQAAGLMTTPASLLRGVWGNSRPFPDRRPIQPGGPPFPTSWLCGAVMLIRSDLFRALGGFDPRFFLYFEESDLCRRACAQGAELWAVGDAVARHVGGASARTTGKTNRSGCIARYFTRSRFYYLAKHFGTCRAVGLEIITAVADALRHLRACASGRLAERRGSNCEHATLQCAAPPRDFS